MSPNTSEKPAIVFDPVAFLTFLASKPPGAPYDFEDNRRCPIAQYVQSQTEFTVSCGTQFANVFTSRLDSFKIPDGWSNAMIGHADTTQGLKAQWTWGQAHERFKPLAA